jgi:tRNA nucleotidyltransferase/poly(A) polymerase
MSFLTLNKWESLVSMELRQELQYIFHSIESASGECYLVGGAVRDMVMGLVPKEFDFATSLLPEEVKKVFKRVIDTGIKHGTVTILLNQGQYEITTYRKDIGSSDGRRPDKVEHGASLEEDLMRRDFTMNALALDLKTLEIIDKHGGLEDIQNRTIRAIGNPKQRFSEDGLRAVRGIRFHTVLDFAIETETYKAIWETREVTRKISVERFFDELLKILKAQKPSLGLLELVKNQIFSLFLDIQESKETEALVHVDFFDLEWLDIRLSLVFLYLLEGETNRIEELSRQLKLSKEQTKVSRFWADLILRMGAQNLTHLQLIRSLSEIKTFAGKAHYLRFVGGYLEILRWKLDESVFVDLKNHIQGILQDDPPLLLSELAINGNVLAQEFPELPKVQYGQALRNCLEYVLEDRTRNHPQELIQCVRRNYAQK